MNTTGKVLTVAGIIVGLAVVGGAVYNESDKSKCIAEGGTWNGLLKGCSCPSGYAMSNGHCCPVGTTWNGTACVASGGSGTNPPAQPTNLTVSNVQVTDANDWTADVAFTGSTGATKPYELFLDGVSIGTLTGTSGTIQGTGVNQQHVVGVAACN